MTSVLGFNSQIRYLKDYADFVAYNQRIAPAYNLAYVDNAAHLPYAKTYADSQSGKTVVRLWHSLDGAFFQKPTGVGDNRYYIAAPQDYLDQYGEYGTGKMILSILNEPNGYADISDTVRRITWLSELLTMAARRKLQLCIYNWGDKHPKLVNGEWDSADDDILRIMAEYPDLFYMGLHLYGDDEITSHLEGYVRRCKSLNISPNRVIVSEFGIDSTGGAENGYKSRNWTGKQYADWQLAQIKGSLKPYIDSGVLVGLCTFCAGNSGGWQAFDIEQDTEYRATIEAAAKTGELAPVTTVKPQPATIIEKPAAAIIGIRQMIHNFGAGQTVHRSLRTRPEWAAPETGQVYKGSIVRVYTIPVETGVIKSDGTKGRWNYVEKLDADKSITNSGWMWVDNITFANGSTSTSENPVVTLPPEPSTPPPAENPANRPSGAIAGLSRSDIEKQVIIAEMQLAYWRDVLARAA